MVHKVAVSLCCVGLAASVTVLGQEWPAGRVGVPMDWSHRHQIFPQPRDFSRLREIQADPRYWHQVYTRSMRVTETSGRRLQPEGARYLPPRTLGGSSGLPKVDWGESMGGAALSFTGLQSYPAKYSFNVANPVPNCTSDYAVFTLPTATTTRFNLIAFKNLYVDNAGTGSCSGTLPLPLFAYNISQIGGTLNSSPSLSLDGTQIAVVESGTSSQFHVVKWRAGDVSGVFGSPYNAIKMTNCATNGAAAPCEWSLNYSSTKSTLGAPYIDYQNDTAYVTDDNGNVTAIKPVFGGGAPAVLWTVAISGGKTLTPPVYDSVSKNVFVADGSGNLYYVRTAASAAGSCASGTTPCQGSATLNAGGGKAVSDAPLVDSTNGTVFVFSPGSPGGANSSVVQTNTTLTTTTVATVGNVGTNPVYSGAFSNTAPGTGVLYACGIGTTGNIPQLYGITFSGSAMTSGPATYGPLSLSTSSAGGCGSLAEVYNQSLGKDELYSSITNRCSASITTGCVRQFDITAGFPAAAANIVSEAGGTLGIIVDNVTNALRGNASETNIYFMTRSSQTCSEHTGGTATSSASSCAVKLTQAALQ